MANLHMFNHRCIYVDQLDMRMKQNFQCFVDCIAKIIKLMMTQVVLLYTSVSCQLSFDVSRLTIINMTKDEHRDLKVFHGPVVSKMFNLKGG